MFIVVNAVKSTDATEPLSMEEVSEMDKDVVVIQITPKTPGTVLISERFICISAVSIGILFRETVEHMLDAKAAVQRLVVDTVTMVHAGDVNMTEDDRTKKLRLIGKTPVMEDVVAKTRCAEWWSLWRRIVLTPMLCCIGQMLYI